MCCKGLQLPDHICPHFFANPFSLPFPTSLVTLSHFQRKSDVRNFSCKSYLLYLLPILLSFAETELLCGKVVRTVCRAVCSFSLPICWKAGTNVIFIRCSFPEKGLEDGRQGRPSWLPSPRFLCPLLPLFGIKNKSDIKRLKGMIFFSERTRREEHLLQRLLREYISRSDVGSFRRVL